jgi:hypothetical protein
MNKSDDRSGQMTTRNEKGRNKCTDRAANLKWTFFSILNIVRVRGSCRDCEYQRVYDACRGI